jgi:hypothetical protein
MSGGSRPVIETGNVGRERANRQLGALGVLLIIFALGLALNSLLGPAFSGLIRYPLSQTMLNQTIGLELFSLFLLAPITIWIGLRALRGHRVAAYLGIGPAAFGVYMFTQYILGPEYAMYPTQVLLHLGMFVLSAAILWMAWPQLWWIGPLPVRNGRLWAGVLAFLAVFILVRYLDPLVKMLQGGGLMSPAFADDVTMYWTIFLLDLGLLVPFILVVSIALLQGIPWASRALYGVIGWFALVPPSIAVMSLVMLWNNDPHASAVSTLVLVASAAVFAWLAYLLYRPVLR